MRSFLTDFKRSTLIGFVVYLFTLILNIFIADNQWVLEKQITYFLINMMFSYALYFGNAYAFDFTNRLFFKNQWHKPIRNLLVGVLSSIIISLILGFVLSIVAAFIYGAQLSDIPNWVHSNDFADIIERVILISLVISLIFYFVNYYQFTQSKKLESKEVIIQKVITSNEALKAQIGPHFLFNSLNVLSGLVDENPEKAQEFIADLSMVYRYVLEQSTKDLIPLKEELNFAKTYMNLVRTRFENGLEFHLDESLYHEEVQIIPLSLQLLLENCIKHNGISKEKPLNISILKEGQSLVIKNNLNPKKQLVAGTGTGLNNIKTKYAQLTTKTVEIIKNNKEFMVRLPFVEQKNIKMNNLLQSDYLEAKERVKQIQGFYTHAIVFLIVNIGLNAFDYFRDYDFQWAYFTTFFWGIGLAVHAIGTFGIQKWTRDWKERKIKEILEKKKNQ